MTIRAPKRASHTYEQHLRSRASEVFPLLCPVRETEWVDGWDPDLVLTNTGIAEDEAVFLIDGAVWTITDYEPPEEYESGLEAGGLAFVKFIEDHTVTHIRIHIWDDQDGETSRARITYSMTAISETGEKEVEAYTEEAFGRFMVTWEDAINAYLGGS